MESVSQWIYDTLGISKSLQYKLFTSLAIVVIFYLIKRVSLHFILKGKQDPKERYSWDKSFSYISYFFIILIVTPIWVKELESLGTFLGLLTAGLAIALKDPISNFFAWVYIIVKKPFEMGDRVQIGNSEGDILNISFFVFTLLEIKNWVEADQTTGRIIHIPNGLLFTQPVINYNQAMNFIWNEIPIIITFESNWQKAKGILLDIEENTLKPLMKNIKPALDYARKNFYMYTEDVNPTVFTKIKPNGVQLTLRYLCAPKQRRKSEQMAYEEILKHFHDQPDIKFAYPTTRFYSREEEKK